MFCGCCNAETTSLSGTENINKSQRAQRRAKSGKENPADTKLESHSSTHANANGSPPKMDPKLNFMESGTLKMLTDVGELRTNNFQHNTLDSTQMSKDLMAHADILARLENPTQY